ncbi:MAG: hypothetical protein QM741_16205 [Rudaea sp.]|uniref:hypothetical protein n=1 Tax=Rudaea sp. TaxID=2136325 RepID=UPI0039E48A4A
MKAKVLIAALLLVAGCSKNTPADVAASAATNAKDAATASALATALTNKDKNAPPTPCETDFSARDAADIFTGPATLNRSAMNAALGEDENGCGLGGSDAFIDFSIHAKPPMQGDNKQTYQTLTSLHDPKGAPLSGVGDKAMWFDVHDSNVPGMNEFDTIAIKGETLCLADLHFKKGADGDKAITPARGEELAKKLGALCNKSFAARGG